ncbi:MAG: recombinase family protein [Candidatus Omnitrophica bacterium]|nr:recombinase family protein [Candidatus Omnitrophota bacterium]
MNLDEKTSVAIYARVSTEEQTENFSLGAQLELLRKHAEEHRYHVIDEYVDGGYSGTSSNRPAFQRMLNDARERKFQIILVYRLDRFFRNNRALLTVSEELEQFDIGIKSLTEPFDTSNHLGKFILSLFGSLAQLERDTFMERSKMGRLRRAREGYYSGTNPVKFGYQCSEDRRKLFYHPVESEVVKIIFNQYCQPEASLVKIAKYLNEHGYKTKTGASWRGDAVHDIIRDPIYTGIWFANRYTQKGKLKPKKDWIQVPVPVIISKDVFQKAQEWLIARRNYTVKNVKYKYLLQGLIKCGDCSSSVSGTADKQHRVVNGKRYGPYLQLYYRCTHFVKNIYKKTVNCNLRYMPAKSLEDVVWGKIEEIFTNPNLISKAVEYQKDHELDGREQLEKESVKVGLRLTALQKEERRMLEAYRQNIISMEQLRDQVLQIKEESGRLSKRKDDIVMLQTSTNTTDVQESIDYVLQVKKGIDKFTYETKKRLLHLLNTRIIANIDGLIDILCTIPSKDACISPKEKSFFSLQPSAGPICLRSAACT